MSTTIQINASSYVLSRTRPFVVFLKSNVALVDTKDEAIAYAGESTHFIDTSTDTVFDPIGRRSYNAKEYFEQWRDSGYPV
jgi:hypothetical protein